MIKAIETRYKGYRFRSRLEARWAVFFDALGVTWQYEPGGFHTPWGPYLPDFRVTGDSGQVEWLEVKPVEPTAIEIMKLAFVVTNSESKGSDYAYFAVGDMGAPALYEFDLNGQLDDRYRYTSDEVPAVFALGLSFGLGIDRKFDAITRAVDLAKSARFEHGESPKYERRTT